MSQTAGAELAAQFGAQHAVVSVVVAGATLPREVASVDQQLLAVGRELRLGGEALERGVAQVGADEQAPLVVELVLVFELMAQGTRFDRTVARFAQEARRRDAAELSIHGEHAAVEGDLLPAVFQLVDELSGLGRAPRERRVRAVAPGLDGVAEALGVLEVAHHTEPGCVAERLVVVEIGATMGVATGGELHLAGSGRLRTLGDEVHGAAGLATTEQRGARTLEHFDALDAGEVARATEAATGVEAVDQIAARQVLIARESADREGVPQTAEVVLPRDRGRKIERLVEVGRTGGGQHFLVDDKVRDRLFEARELTAIGLTRARDHHGLERVHRLRLQRRRGPAGGDSDGDSRGGEAARGAVLIL